MSLSGFNCRSQQGDEVRWRNHCCT